MAQINIVRIIHHLTMDRRKESESHKEYPVLTVEPEDMMDELDNSSGVSDTNAIFGGQIDELAEQLDPKDSAKDSESHMITGQIGAVSETQFKDRCSPIAQEIGRPIRRQQSENQYFAKDTMLHQMSLPKKNPSRGGPLGWKVSRSQSDLLHHQERYKEFYAYSEKRDALYCICGASNSKMLNADVMNATCNAGNLEETNCNSGHHCNNGIPLKDTADTRHHIFDCDGNCRVNVQYPANWDAKIHLKIICPTTEAKEAAESMLQKDPYTDMNMDNNSQKEQIAKTDGSIDKNQPHKCAEKKCEELRVNDAQPSTPYGSRDESQTKLTLIHSRGGEAFASKLDNHNANSIKSIKVENVKLPSVNIETAESLSHIGNSSSDPKISNSNITNGSNPSTDCLNYTLAERRRVSTGVENSAHIAVNIHAASTCCQMDGNSASPLCMNHPQPSACICAEIPAQTHCKGVSLFNGFKVERPQKKESKLISKHN